MHACVHTHSTATCLEVEFIVEVEDVHGEDHANNQDQSTISDENMEEPDTQTIQLTKSTRMVGLYRYHFFDWLDFLGLQITWIR